MSSKKATENGIIETLRPSKWDEFIGQEQIKKTLTIHIEATQKRNEPCDHLLFYGPAGLGKTTLANLVAKAIGANLKITSGTAIERTGDLASLLSNLQKGDALFIDEAHRLPRTVEEVLYPAMESRTLDIILGKGPAAKSIQIQLAPFTLLCATTRVGLLSSPFRSRFGGIFKLDFYNQSDIEQILTRSAKILGVDIKKDAIAILAAASRSTPRTANRLLKRTWDVATVENEKIITPEIAQKALELLEIDELGLEHTDRKLLEAVIQKFNGGPVGIQSLAAATNEEKDTIEDYYEPYLLRLGFLQRTQKGRIATPLAYAHLKTANNKLL